MNLAFALYKYFPYGGMQRDCLAIARACVARGARVRVYTLRWQGEVPQGVEVREVPARGIANHVRYARFHDELVRQLSETPADAVVGFNKMPGLDVYYAADGSFAQRLAERPRWYRWAPRARHFLAAEHAVFGRGSATQILLLSATQQAAFARHFLTEGDRLHLLPPGIARDRMAGPDATVLRHSLRREFGLAERDSLILLVGSGFVTKGLDRALRAVAALAPDRRARVQFIAIGQDAPARFIALARKLGIAPQVRILAGRADIPRFLQGADLLLHPARAENTGTILLEAIVAGLPVLTVAACGYAHFVTAADAGRVLPAPFAQPALNAALADMLAAPERTCWRKNGIAFGRTQALYDMPERAAALILQVAANRAAAGLTGSTT